LGSEFRFDYTLIGAATNLANRLEGLNKYLGTDILISDVTRRQLDEGIVVRSLGRFLLAGAAHAMPVYEVLGQASERASELPWLHSFAKALLHFQKGEFSDAERLFQQVTETRDGDGPSMFYLKEIETALEAPSKLEDWDGVIRLTSK